MGIVSYLADGQVPFTVFPHPPAFTAQRRAKVLRVPGARVAKGVLMRGPRGLFLAVLPATHRIDLRLLSARLDGPVRLADSSDLPALFLDCEWGAVPAFGSRYALPTFLEEAFHPEDALLFEGTSHFEDVRLRCADYIRLERPHRLRFSRPAHPRHSK